MAQAAGAASALGSITRTDSALAVLSGVSPRIWRYAAQSAARDLVPAERVAHCLRHRVDGGKPVDVVYVLVTESAHYGNLMTCGSIWLCPVCAAKISERRRLELDEGINRWWAGGGAMVLMTFTLRHHLGEGCAEVLAAACKAQRDFWCFRAGQRLQADFGIVGKIRGLETTYGDNGWHVHFHVLVFLGQEYSDDQLAMFTSRALDHWQHVLVRVGRDADDEHGLMVQRGVDDVAQYVAKFGQDDGWSLAHEVAKAHVKRSSKHGFTPGQLLALYLAGQDRAGALWQEYAAAFKGHKQLEWSPGLRKVLGLGQERTDGELVEQQDEVGMILARLSFEQWRWVLSNDIRAEVLEVASSGDWRKVKAFLELCGIRGVQYPTEVETKRVPSKCEEGIA